MTGTAFLPPAPPLRSTTRPLRPKHLPAGLIDPTMSDTLRQQITSSARLVVVKVGTRVLTHADGTLNHERIDQLAEEIHTISAGGRQVVLVSSGAVGAGSACSASKLARPIWPNCKPSPPSARRI